MSKKRAPKEIPSGCGYDLDYEPRGFAEQQQSLRRLFPDLRPGYEELTHPEYPLPKGAESYFAIPRWEKLARSYGQAVQKLLKLLEKRMRKGLFNADIQLGPSHLRQHDRTQAFFQKISEDQQGSDILVIPAQFGRRHRNNSAKGVRERMVPSEFGLGIFAVGIMLLTHPDRIFDAKGLGINCIGDVCFEEFDDATPDVPQFMFATPDKLGGYNHLLDLGTSYITDERSRHLGSATGFVLPQFPPSSSA